MNAQALIDARSVCIEAIANESKMLLNDPHPGGNLLLRLSALVSVHSAFCRELETRDREKTFGEMMERLYQLRNKLNVTASDEDLSEGARLQCVMMDLEEFLERLVD